MQLVMKDPAANPATRVSKPTNIKNGESAHANSLTNQSIGAGQRRRIKRVLLRRAARLPAITTSVLNMVMTRFTVLKCCV